MKKSINCFHMNLRTLLQAQSLTPLNGPSTEDEFIFRSIIQDPSLAKTVDLLLVVASFSLFIMYHVWYYSWRFKGIHRVLEGHGYQRLDVTGLHGRLIFVAAMLSDVENGRPLNNADMNLAVQATRNPITAASILATGSSVAATTILNILTDEDKMADFKRLGKSDPLTGDNNVLPPEIYLGLAFLILLASFFALMQSLRLFSHFGFLIRAATFAYTNPEHSSVTCTGDELGNSSCLVMTRAHTFFSIGLRGLILFLPLVVGAFGGTYLFVSTVMVIFALFFLDHI